MRSRIKQEAAENLSVVTTVQMFQVDQSSSEVWKITVGEKTVWRDYQGFEVPLDKVREHIEEDENTDLPCRNKLR